MWYIKIWIRKLNLNKLLRIDNFFSSVYPYFLNSGNDTKINTFASAIINIGYYCIKILTSYIKQIFETERILNDHGNIVIYNKKGVPLNYGTPEWTQTEEYCQCRIVFTEEGKILHCTLLIKYLVMLLNLNKRG